MAAVNVALAVNLQQFDEQEKAKLAKIQAVARGRYQRRLRARKNNEAHEKALSPEEVEAEHKKRRAAHKRVSALGREIELQHGAAEHKDADHKEIDSGSPAPKKKQDVWSRMVLGGAGKVHPNSMEREDSTYQRLQAIETIVPGFSKRHFVPDSPKTPLEPTQENIVVAQAQVSAAYNRIRRRSTTMKPHEIHQIAAVVQGYRLRTHTSKWLVMPESNAMQYWDVVAMFALFFTAIVTPYEVALLKTKAHSPLFYVNRLVDLVFLADLVLSFFTAYRKRVESKLIWVTDLKVIRKKYLYGWFIVDFASIIPFDVLTMLASGAVAKFLGRLRMVRLLKLVRMVKIMRIYKRWESRIAVPYAYIALMNFSLLLTICGHWMACLWAIIGLNGEEGKNWIDLVLQDIYLSGSEATSWQIYGASLYWAITTITSVGYGDIIPQSVPEMRWCTILIMFGSILWAYIIGNACGIVNTLDVATMNHRQTMDQLNRFMEDQGMPTKQRLRLRAYFNNCRDIAKSDGHRQLISKMSPALKEEVAYSASRWLANLDYFRGVSSKFVATLSNEVISNVFVPAEVIEWSNALFGVARGVAARHGQVLLAGGLWGADFILETHELKDTAPTRALTYVEVLVLDRDIFFEMLEDFPDIKERVRASQVRMAISRGILRVAKVIKNAQLSMEQVLTLVQDAKDEVLSAKNRALLFEDTSKQKLRRSISMENVRAESAMDAPRSASKPRRVHRGSHGRVDALHDLVHETADRLEKMGSVHDLMIRIERKLDMLMTKETEEDMLLKEKE